MKNTWNKAAWALLASPLLFASCEKEDHGSLEGSLPTASFTSSVDASQFPVRVTFTDTSQDAFANTWEFGDGTTGRGATVTHTYNTPGTYKVRVLEAGRGGTTSGALTDVVVPSACAVGGFSALVNCNGNTPSARVWTYSTAEGAIKRLDADNNLISSSKANNLSSCQADDQFTFNGSSFNYNYGAGDSTFVNGNCGGPQSGGTSFVFKPVAGTLGQIVLQKAADKPALFIGEAVAVNNMTYDIIEASNTILRLRGTLADGTKTEVTLVPFDAVTRIKQLLTGGSQKTWMLDTAEKAITVGTESDPAQYYGGGAANSLPGCQKDDEFTFSNDNIYTYNAKAETLVAPDQTCQAPRSTTSPFTFGPADGTGLAQFVFTKAGTFIGATDAAADLTYRILSISENNMVLRAGTGKNGGTVFDIKLIAKK